MASWNRQCATNNWEPFPPFDFFTRCRDMLFLHFSTTMSRLRGGNQYRREGDCTPDESRCTACLSFHTYHQPFGSLHTVSCLISPTSDSRRTIQFSFYFLSRQRFSILYTQFQLKQVIFSFFWINLVLKTQSCSWVDLENFTFHHCDFCNDIQSFKHILSTFISLFLFSCHLYFRFISFNCMLVLWHTSL